MGLLREVSLVLKYKRYSLRGVVHCITYSGEMDADVCLHCSLRYIGGSSSSDGGLHQGAAVTAKQVEEEREESSVGN